MKAMHRVMVGMSVFAATVSPAFATAGGGGERHGSLAAWIFLGFCALVVVAQLIPAALLFIGIIKGVFQKGEEKASVSVKSIK